MRDHPAARHAHMHTRAGGLGILLRRLQRWVHTGTMSCTIFESLVLELFSFHFLNLPMASGLLLPCSHTHTHTIASFYVD
jgi:hypothetical protein